MPLIIPELATIYLALRLWQRMPISARNVRNHDESPEVFERLSALADLNDTTDINEFCHGVLSEINAQSSKT